jgi:hypothetical protein
MRIIWNHTMSAHSPRSIAICVIAGVLALSPALALGISLGQVDDFEDGTTASWTDGVNGNTANITTGGPAGANDNYLQISSGSFGGQSRMTVFNRSQWVGNYLAAGVTAISMDLRNFGSSAIPIRIAIREGTGGSSTPGYASTTAFSLAADGQWHTAVFSLAASDLTPINSPQPLTTDLANVAEFRLLSSASPSTLGDVISARIGVDNITAVPEPATIALTAFGLAGAWMFRRRP